MIIGKEKEEKHRNTTKNIGDTLQSTLNTINNFAVNVCFGVI